MSDHEKPASFDENWTRDDLQIQYRHALECFTTLEQGYDTATQKLNSVETKINEEHTKCEKEKMELRDEIFALQEDLNVSQEENPNEAFELLCIQYQTALEKIGDICNEIQTRRAGEKSVASFSARHGHHQDDEGSDDEQSGGGGYGAGAFGRGRFGRGAFDRGSSGRGPSGRGGYRGGISSGESSGGLSVKMGKMSMSDPAKLDSFLSKKPPVIKARHEEMRKDLKDGEDKDDDEQEQEQDKND